MLSEFTYVILTPNFGLVLTNSNIHIDTSHLPLVVNLSSPQSRREHESGLSCDKVAAFDFYKILNIYGSTMTNILAMVILISFLLILHVYHLISENKILKIKLAEVKESNDRALVSIKTLNNKNEMLIKDSGKVAVELIKSDIDSYLRSLNEKDLDVLFNLILDAQGNLRENDDGDSGYLGNGLSDFHDDLTTVWSDKSLEIEFSYRNARGERSRRTVALCEVLTNMSGDIYFYSFCHDAGDFRHFNTKRITSKIQYNGLKYDIDDFFDAELSVDYDRLLGL